jgi:hypothetical protein
MNYDTSSLGIPNFGAERIPNFGAERYSLIEDGSNFHTCSPAWVSVRCGHPVTLSLLLFMIFKR